MGAADVGGHLAPTPNTALDGRLANDNGIDNDGMGMSIVTVIVMTMALVIIINVMSNAIITIMDDGRDVMTGHAIPCNRTAITIRIAMTISFLLFETRLIDGRLQRLRLRQRQRQRNHWNWHGH